MTTLDQFIRNLFVGRRAVRNDGLDRRAFLRTLVVGAAIAPTLPAMIERVTVRPWGRTVRTDIYSPSFVQMIKDLADPNWQEAMRAREAFAAFITPVLQNVIDSTPLPLPLFISREPLSIPLDRFDLFPA
jgi:hypothetical protein